MKIKLNGLLTLLLVTSNLVYAAQGKVHINLPIDNRSFVASDSWINMLLQNKIVSQVGEQFFTAKTVDPIYDVDFTKLLIPANSTVKGKYHNNGESCYFSIDEISFNNTEIELNPGAYTTVNVVQPKQIGCNVKLNYAQSQLMIFQTKAVIPELDVIEEVKPGIKKEDNNFSQAFTSPYYSIKNIISYNDDLIQLTLTFNKPEIKDKLSPLYYDSYGVAHELNYKVSSTNGNEYSYLFLSHYTNFGFGMKG